MRSNLSVTPGQGPGGGGVMNPARSGGPMFKRAFGGDQRSASPSPRRRWHHLQLLPRPSEQDVEVV